MQMAPCSLSGEVRLIEVKEGSDVGVLASMRIG